MSQLTDLFTDIANAIRGKKGTSDAIPAQNFASEITNLPSGGGANINDYFETNRSTNALPIFLARFVKQFPQITAPVVTNFSRAFDGFDLITEIDFTNIDKSNATNMYYMFANCTNLPSINMNGFDTSNVLNMQGMFYNCRGMTSLDISDLNTSKTTTLTSMFVNCINLTSLNLSNFDTSNVTSMTTMFDNCSKLTSLDISGFNGASATSINTMFRNCSNLSSINISGLENSNTTSLTQMFNGCTRLKDLVLGNFHCDSINVMTNAFARCSNMANISGTLSNIGKGYTSATVNLSAYRITLNASTKLTHDSMMNIINGLYDLETAGKAKQSLVFGSTNLAKLSSAEIAIATTKGWNVT